MSKVKLETNNVMPQIVAASAYRRSVNELFKTILETEPCTSGYYIKELIRDFIEVHKGEV